MMNEKTETISLRLSSEEMTLLKQKCQASGLSQSELLRQCLKNSQIICLDQQDSVASHLFSILSVLTSKDGCVDYTVKQEVKSLCSSLNLLMEKMKALQS